jgi:hypothetical protein
MPTKEHWLVEVAKHVDKLFLALCIRVHLGSKQIDERATDRPLQQSQITAVSILEYSP